MTRERAAELTPIIQAYADGKKVQVHTSDGWMDSSSPTFNDLCSWRIKPEPREWWIVPNSAHCAPAFTSESSANEHIKQCVEAPPVVHVREIDP